MARRKDNRRSRSGPPTSPKSSAIERKDAAAIATTISKLPVDIISDILFRLLDIKSIIRYMGVCKTWRDLLLQSYFTKLQLSRGSLPLFLIFHHRSNGPLHSSHFGILELDDLACLRRRNATMKFRHENLLPHKDGSVRVIGACNGLICFYANEDIVVCNPILQGRRRFILPKLVEPTPRERTVGIGFGYSSVSDKYKVLRCVERNSVEFEICTLGSDETWRNIARHKEAPSPDSYFCVDDFIFVKGALHWVCLGMGSKLICCFDVENEKFKNLPLPCQIKDGDRFNLGAVDNCLCLSIWCSPDHVNVWVLNDYQDTGSWALKWTFELCIRGLDWSIKLLKIFEDGSVLMIFKNKTIGCYNPQTGVLKKVKYHNVQLESVAMAYTPSFVSPPLMQ